MENLLNELYLNQYYEDYIYVKELFDEEMIELSNVRNLQTYLERIDYELDTDKIGLEYMLG